MGYVRLIRNTDGTPTAAPSSLILTVAGFSTYADDAAYEAANGAGALGRSYANSTELLLRFHNGTEWVYLQNGINSLEDSTSTGADQDLDPTYHNHLLVSEASLTSVRSIDPAQTRIVYLTNKVGAPITLKHEDPGATATKRMSFPNQRDFILDDGSTAYFVYDEVNSLFLYTNSLAAGNTIQSGEITAPSYTFDSGDLNATMQLTENTASAISLEIPLDLGTVGDTLTIVQMGTGVVTWTAAGGVTLNASGGLVDMANQYAMATAVQTSANVWVLTGDRA